MSKGIKCIICQSWDVVSADGYKIETRTCYVTNEDGTPHVYDTIKKARADIRGNYGRYPNANGFLRDVYTDEYSGKTTYSYISIIREDSDDYEYAMRQAEQQAADNAATTKQAEEKQAKEAERAERKAKLAITRTRHMTIGEKKQQAHTIEGNDGWRAKVSYRDCQSFRDFYYWRVDVFHNGVYFCHDLFWTIEEAEEYAEGMTAASPVQIVAEAKDETETTDAPRVIDYIDRDAAEELHTLRHDQLWSWYELATINGITTRQAREVFAIIHNNIPCLFEDEANKETHEANIHAANAALDDASEAEHKASDAACKGNIDEAAKYAAEAREAADRAEKIAKSADDSARTGNACSVAESIAEIAYYARRSATQATETAELAAAEAGAPEDIAHYCHEQARRYNWTAEETAEEIAYYTDLRTANAAARALLGAYAEATGDYPDDVARAAYKVARADIVARGREAHDEQRETVARMVERIAAHIYGIVILDADGVETETTDYPTEAERDEAERNLNASGYAYMGNIGEYDYYREPEADDDADALAKYRDNPYMVFADDAEYPDATPALPYQRAELLALLGDFADQYDVDAIEAEATEYDARTGHRIWTATGDDLTQIIEAHEMDPDEAAAACEAGNVNIYNEETGEYVAVNLAPAGMADALVNAFCSNGTPQEVYDACIALADAYTGGEDTSAEEAALGVQVATGPFVKEWHMSVNIDDTVQDFCDPLAEDAADETAARETLRRRWNNKHERRFYLAPDTERIVDVYYNLI